MAPKKQPNKPKLKRGENTNQTHDWLNFPSRNHKDNHQNQQLSLKGDTSLMLRLPWQQHLRYGWFEIFRVGPCHFIHPMSDFPGFGFSPMGPAHRFTRVSRVRLGLIFLLIWGFPICSGSSPWFSWWLPAIPLAFQLSGV